MIKKRGQVWVETVVYTLIGLTIIGAMMAVLIPRINQMSDRAIIAQTINSLNMINDQFGETAVSSGVQREVSISVKKGEYTIDSENNALYFLLKDTNLLYSQPGEQIHNGDIIILTTEKTPKKFDIKLLLNYSAFNITYQDKDAEKILSSSPVPYRLLIQNKDGASRQINFEPI